MLFPKSVGHEDMEMQADQILLNTTLELKTITMLYSLYHRGNTQR